MAWFSSVGLDVRMRRLSFGLFWLLAVCLAINTVGIPRRITLKADEFDFERPQYVYMLKNTARRLRFVPFLFDVMEDTSLGKIARGSLRMSENGRPLPKPFSSMQEMMDKGEGKYYYRPERLSFTTSDNSDPRTNGRIYVVDYRFGVRWWVLGLLTLVFVGVRSFLALKEMSK
jgi:hypothetical protein